MREIPVVTKNLIAINVLMFLALLAFERSGIDLNNLLGLHLFLAPDFRPYQLVTYMFMHGGFTHILFNMYAVWVFGSILERVWGSSRFLLFYIVTGVGAGLVQELVQYLYFSMNLAQYTQVNMGGGLIVPMAEYLNLWTTVGASGAVYGILLAFAMTFPNEQLFMIPFPFPIKAKYFVMIFGALELFTGLSNNVGDNVAHFAHLGGMIFGIVLILYWRKKGKIDGPYNF
ncbi:MAG: rhomboid family intramembrane serine protease [Bacteroidaceae bacterium]|jgi:membrane associated rhomboid family serine protease|nr:rhomboid family intramembrane serine protease [Bacteroidaceae bacterium]MBQ5706256.1 rhomboid family intramembrane serine protease [Bacteroidaceae bacterium]MBQ5817163.1 rhomboid family intramembrane serine protease [Bacteroidaceae bacterium]